MTATEVLPYDAPRATWLACRRLGLGGSDIAPVMGMSRWSTPRDVWMDKTGRGHDKPQTWPMTVGHALEEPMLQWFSQQTGIRFHRVGLLRNDERSWMQVSLDGALTDDDGIAECKSVGWRLSDEWGDDQVADAAELQVQWAMAVTGRSHAWVIAAIDGDDPVFRRVDRDDQLIRTLIDGAGRFWEDNVLADVEPPLSARDLDTVRSEWPRVERVSVVGGPLLEDAVSRRAEAIAHMKQWQQVRDKAEAELIVGIGDADQLVIDGHVWATRSEQTSRVLDREAVAAAGIDLDEFKVERVSRVLRVPAANKRKALTRNG